MTKFAYNNTINIFTNMTLFEANLKYNFRIFFENSQDSRAKSKSTKKNTKYLQKLLDVLRANLIDAQTKQTKY